MTVAGLVLFFLTGALSATIGRNKTLVASEMKDGIGNIFGPHILHPKLPIAVESIPTGSSSGNAENICDPHRIIQCNQGASTDIGLALAGLVSKESLCLKYIPAESCVSLALSSCPRFTDFVLKRMLLSFARIIVSWCSNEKNALNGFLQKGDCYSLALFDSITAHNCLSNVSPRQRVLPTSRNSPKQDLRKVVDSFPGSDDSSVITCLHGAIAEACGKTVTDLNLKSPTNGTASQKGEGYSTVNRKPAVHSKSPNGVAKLISTDKLPFLLPLSLGLFLIS